MYWLTVLCISSADDMDAIPVKQFVKHVMELYKSNMQGFAEEFEVNFHTSSMLPWLFTLTFISYSSEFIDDANRAFTNTKLGLLDFSQFVTLQPKKSMYLIEILLCKHSWK